MARPGLTLALEHEPELILCDLLMPRANGFQVCRNLRHSLQRTKIIIISGRDYGVDRTSAIEAGADEYLVKPILWEHLHEVIERVMPNGGKAAILTGPLPEFTPPSTRLKFWGVRGSIPVPGSSTVGYGGNTSCIEVRADGEIIILDAGSGMWSLGIALEEEFKASPIKLTILISHTHWDHIQGLPFFLPAYNSKNSLRVLGYEGAREGLATILANQMETSVLSCQSARYAGDDFDRGAKGNGFLDRKSARPSSLCESPRYLRRVSAFYLPGVDRLSA